MLRLELKGTPIGTTLVEMGPIPTDMLEHVNDFTPTRKSFDRFYKLQLLVDIPKEQVADEVVAAVEAGKRHVRLPKRAFAFPSSTRRRGGSSRRCSWACAAGLRRGPPKAYTGSTPCLRHGRSTCFVRETCRPFQIASRVSAGSMTSSTCAWPAAM